MIDSTIPELPELSAENLAAVMEERIAATRNEAVTIPMLWQGLWRMKIPCGMHLRIATLYIPVNTPQGTSFVLLNVPEGQECGRFLQNSGWLALADAKDLCIFAAEPSAGGWNATDEELTFFTACLKALFDGVYLRGGMSVYVVGYGTAGSVLHRLVMKNPLKIAAASFHNASDIDDGFIEDAESALLEINGNLSGIHLSEIPVPVQIFERKMNATAQKAAAHWLRAIGVDEPEKNAEPSCVYHQEKASVFTPDGCIAQVVVKESCAGCCQSDVTAEIGRFLMRFIRFGKDGPFGNSLLLKPDYTAMGIEYLTFCDENGTVRECLVYVPKTWKDHGKLPLVVALHGAYESVINFFEESLWYKKAEKEGFIVAMPEGVLKPSFEGCSGMAVRAYRSLFEKSETAGRHSDLGFIEQILDRIIEQYPVDETRIYCTGHSMGCMMTSFIGSSRLGRRFAAIAGTSGILDSWDPTGTEIIPVFLTAGQYDLTDYRLEKDTPLTAALDRWLVRDGISSEKTVKTVRINGASDQFIDGRANCSVWTNASGLPLVRYEWIQGKDHMNTPEENARFWDLWFSKWTLDPENGRCFSGIPLEGAKRSDTQGEQNA